MTAEQEQSQTPSAITVAHFIPIRLEAETPMIDVWELVRAVRHGWLTVLVAAALFGLAAIAWAFYAQPVYRASVQVMPVSEDASTGPLASLMNQVGGLAALVGFGSASSGAQKVRALALLRSRRVLQSFIVEKNLMPDLFPDAWDANAGAWRAGIEPPTIEDGYARFIDSVLGVEEDKQTGLVVVTIDWHDPVQAAELANALIGEVNRQMRTRAIDDSQKSIAYLNDQLAKTELMPLRESIYRLVDAQLRSIMLASIQDDYGLSIVDPATPPDTDRYVWPRRLWLSIGGVVLGAFLGMFVVVVRAGIRRGALPSRQQSRSAGATEIV